MPPCAASRRGASVDSPLRTKPPPALRHGGGVGGVGVGGGGGGDGGGGLMEVCSEEGLSDGDSAGEGILQSLPTGSSNRRVAPRGEIPLGGAPLPEGAVWREVRVAVGRGGSTGKTAAYGWAFLHGDPLCKWCMKELGSGFFHEGAKRAQEGRVLQAHELFCSGACLQEFFQRTTSGALRRAVRTQDRGVCATCGLDCCALTKRVQLEGDADKRRALVLRSVPAFATHPRLLERFVLQPLEGNLWHADHVVPVHLGGGECGLDNIRSLCVLCHSRVSAEQSAARAGLRRTQALSSDVASNTPPPAAAELRVGGEGGGDAAEEDGEEGVGVRVGEGRTVFQRQGGGWRRSGRL